MRTEGIFLNIINVIYDKHSQRYTQWAKTSSVSLKIENNTGISTFTTLSQHSTGSPSHSDQIRRKNKRYPNGKEEVNMFFFADDMILYTENPKIYTQKNPTRTDK